jgi:hypothetical protein
VLESTVRRRRRRCRQGLLSLNKKSVNERGRVLCEVQYSTVQCSTIPVQANCSERRSEGLSSPDHVHAVVAT